MADVDNVPLLVSLFTDSTEDSTKSMVEIFKEDSDTVLVLGCSHVSRNIKIFGSSDVSVGVDTVEEEDGDCNDPGVREAMRFAREVITRGESTKKDKDLARSERRTLTPFSLSSLNPLSSSQTASSTSRSPPSLTYTT